MPRTRREFLATSLSASATLTAGFAGLRLASAASVAPTGGPRFGPLIDDPKGLLDLPKGFSYRVISRRGEEMDDGLLLPGRPDGMAALPGPAGLTLLMRNHELSPRQETAFGEHGERLAAIDTSKLYDPGAPAASASIDAGRRAATPGGGGVTTLVYDTRRQRVVRQFLRLGGTIRNCAGGPTPWGSWVTCEEATDSPTYSEKEGYRCGRDHGYAFDVPASATPGLLAAEPLKAMGRFRREAVAVDPASSAVYQTEDMDDGAFYRFLPNEAENLSAGGKLQALKVSGRPSLDTRNWKAGSGSGAGVIAPGEKLAVEWIDLDDPESPKDDLRYRAFASGAARFARGEGIWWTDGGAYFACTSGGRAEIGQIWRIVPDGGAGGSLELFIEPNDSNLIENADNLTGSPWGDLVVCEDRQGEVVRLIGVSADGGVDTLANNRARCEFAGACFSPDGSTLFVNIQAPGLTIAITGPWPAAS
ncbi:MAG: alkaline phosphatase PhoX [Planctomycetota bacterium]